MKRITYEKTIRNINNAMAALYELKLTPKAEERALIHLERAIATVNVAAYGSHTSSPPRPPASL